MIAAQPLGRLTLNRPLKILMGLSLAGIAGIIWRFAAGLGASTALNDGYPWGLWIAFDVVTGTALACGGYAVALLVYAFNRGQYHPLIRPAIVTSALGYTMAGLSVALDVGRPYFIWKVPLYFWSWNLNSALLEVALCIMAYTLVVWLELAPAALERWRQERSSRLSTLAHRLTPAMYSSLTWIIAFAMLLPTMHQSSLGTLMVLSGPRLHELWQTSWLPLLFLIVHHHGFRRRGARNRPVALLLEAAPRTHDARQSREGRGAAAGGPSSSASVMSSPAAFRDRRCSRRPSRSLLVRTGLVRGAHRDAARPAGRHAPLPQRDGADRRGRPVRLTRSWSRFSPAIITAIFRASANWPLRPAWSRWRSSPILIIHYFPIMSGTRYATAEEAGV